MNSTQRKIAAIACWVGAAAIVVAHATERDGYGRLTGEWLAWLAVFRWERSALGGLWAILFAALGAIAWTARGTRPPST